MNEPKTPFDPDTSEQTLRSRANDRLRSPDDPDLELMSPEETRRLVHELRVYQVELEIQNEDLRRAQEELEASRARFADLYDFAPAGYLTVSETGLIIEANLTVANQLGVARGTLLKQPLTRFILAAEQDVYYRHREVLFETGRQQTCLPSTYQILPRSSGTGIPRASLPPDWNSPASIRPSPLRSSHNHCPFSGCRTG